MYDRMQKRRAHRIEWEEMKACLQNTLLVAAAVMVGSFPMFYHHFDRLGHYIFPHFPVEKALFRLALSQSLILFMLAFLCCLVGFLYAGRLHLPVFRQDVNLKSFLTAGLTIGLLLTPVSYFLFDRAIMLRIPDIYPRTWYWAISNMIGTGISQEVILRTGLFTIGVYFFRRTGIERNPWPVSVVISGFAAAASYMLLSKFQLSERLDFWKIVLAQSAVFIRQMLFCEIYLRKGLSASILFHVGMEVKLLVYVFLRVG